MNELWQRACLGVTTVGPDRGPVDRVLQDVSEWLRVDRSAAVIRIEQEVE
jgi:uncharacterized protein YlxP (DUF503 family)